MSLLASLFETKLPDGWFEHDLLWWDTSISQATCLARGARLSLPDLSSADSGTREAFYEAFGSFMSQLGDGESVKFQWTVDSDYHSDLETYRRRTQEAGATGWCWAVREERYLRFADLMAAGRLRRERLDVYLSKRCTSVPKAGFRTQEQIERFLEQTAKTFEDRFADLSGRLPGAHLTPFGDREHFSAMRDFLQPSLKLVGEERSEGLDERGTIMENCFPGGGVTTRDPEGNVYFKMDGQYHAMLVLRRWPMETHMGIIWSLTSAMAGNYCITLNCYPLSAQAEIDKLNHDLRKIEGQLKTEKVASLEDVWKTKKQRLNSITSGFARPYSVLPVVRVWDTSLEGLQARVTAVKTAITSMGGAACWQVDQESQAKNLFYETIPGWMGGRYRDWDLFAFAGRETSSCFLQDMLPLASSYTGHLEDGEALYDGDAGNLVGVRMFANGTPQHSVMIGTTRVGKSSQTIDYLSQTDCFFDFRGIIEEGLSYGTLVKLLGGKSIILHPDGEETINYFDTNGMPLTREHLSFAAGLLQVMTGRVQDPEVNMQRKSMISEYLNQTYTDTWADHCLVNLGAELRAARLAMTIERLRKASTGYQALTILEMFADLKAQDAEKPGYLDGLLEQVPEDDALAFAKVPHTRMLVRDIGLSFLSPADFKTHTSLVEQMSYNRLEHHSKDVVDRMVSNLTPWTRHGQHGKLFDGITNTTLDSRLVHFELGLLPSSNVEMKEAAVFLIANRLRQRIVTMPRALRKQFIFEEPSRYLKVGGMEELFAEFYAQMGKFGCHIMPVTQQYGQLARSSLRPVIFGNSKQYFLFKQNDRHDLDDIGDAIGLPEAAREAIRGFTAPEYQSGDEKFSQMAVFSQEGDRADCGVIRNYVTPEMLYVSDSSGATYDARMKAMAEYEHPMDAVEMETRKMLQNANTKPKKRKIIQHA